MHACSEGNRWSDSVWLCNCSSTWGFRIVPFGTTYLLSTDNQLYSKQQYRPFTACEARSQSSLPTTKYSSNISSRAIYKGCTQTMVCHSCNERCCCMPSYPALLHLVWPFHNMILRHCFCTCFRAHARAHPFLLLAPHACVYNFGVAQAISDQTEPSLGPTKISSR